MQRLSVLFPNPLGCYDYLSQESIPVGTFVTAPFGRRKMTGVVWDKVADVNLLEEKLKQVETTLNLPALPLQSVQFVNWVSSYTLTPLGSVLKMTLTPEMEKESKKPLIFQRPDSSFSRIAFSEQQQQAVDILSEQIDSSFQVSLLDGVTGSGKTEVYFEAIAKALEANGQVLVLLPEITLTTAWLERFEKRFGCKPALWHSNITPKQRRDTWKGVLENKVSVVVGARSALFLPFVNLKLIVVDEEHDSSFKQEDGVLYQARDMAVVRAKIANCPIILASATPSLETYCNAINGKYQHIELPQRYAGATLPDIRLIDMRQKTKGAVRFISPELQALTADVLEKKEQALYFLNRRGYAPLILCRSCGERLKCPHCSAWLVEHRKKNFVQCHHCGHTRYIPKKCPTCEQEDTFVSCGPGVERIEEEARLLFPNAVLQVVTSDTLANPKEFATILDKIQKKEIDILIGTQILAKGHHFADLTLVGIIDADMGLAGGDLRACERTFQLLHQVSGRAGRAQKKGTAVLQTYTPESLIIQALRDNDRTRFFEEEITSREILKMPPFGKLAGLILSGKNEQIVLQTAQKIVQKAPFTAKTDVLGPTPAPLSLLRGKYRYRILLKTDKDVNIQAFLSNWLKNVIVPASVDLRIDIDPYSFF